MLRADRADVASYARVLTGTLAAALPEGMVEVEQRRGLGDRVAGRGGRPSQCTDQERSAARSVGALLAAAGVVVLCGGGSGVMAAVVDGARSAGGLVIGIRPGNDLDDAEPGLSAVVATGMGEARNAV